MRVQVPQRLHCSAYGAHKKRQFADSAQASGNRGRNKKKRGAEQSLRADALRQVIILL